MSSDQTSDRLGAGEPEFETALKRPWHAPKLEQVDYTAAEAGGLYQGSDGAVYQSQ